MKTTKPPLPRPPIFVLIFVSMFGFIGLALLIFLWSSPSDFPPLIFKVFASCIAIAFMAMGFGMPITALLARNAFNENQTTVTAPVAEAEGYKCPNCGAGLGQQEVSPSGDVKCTYCHKWWNIHKAA